MAKKTDLIRWYNINKSLNMSKLNRFWFTWEKTKLSMKRLYKL